MKPFVLAVLGMTVLCANARAEIYFGDLHVHTGDSLDGLVFSLPIYGGEGPRSVKDACDFAKYCSKIDFFSINDHAESYTPALWKGSVEQLQSCETPTLIPFAGWEWTQVGTSRLDHAGHRNIVFKTLDPKRLPPRAIGSLDPKFTDLGVKGYLARILKVFNRLTEYGTLFARFGSIASTKNCPPNVSSADLSKTCRETAVDTAALNGKLDQWNDDSLIILHGSAWGNHTPRGFDIRSQLTRARDNPARQGIAEIFSGHGNSETYHPYPSVNFDAEGNASCPAATDDFTPCCWQAGEIMRSRCGNLPSDQCEARVQEARTLAIQAGMSPYLVFPDAHRAEWLNCDQPKGGFKPTSAPNGKSTLQYALAISNFDEPGPDGRPLRFRFGFIGSSDNHKARAGNGYKQYFRKGNTESDGLKGRLSSDIIDPIVLGRQKDHRRAQAGNRNGHSIAELLDVEAISSFTYTGGLVAVHAPRLSRDAIWEAVQSRNVYATSGPRINLWFDMIQSDGTLPMGAALETREEPRFRVRAQGSPVQKPGCPAYPVAEISPKRLEALCHGECNYPSEQHLKITDIEVVRIRPQAYAGEPVDRLIEDVWKRIPCPADSDECVVEFTDPEFKTQQRDTLYYVRALQEPTPAINGANLRTRFDSRGRAVSVKPCYGDYRTPFNDDCLANVAERAWSSPIYVDWKR